MSDPKDKKMGDGGKAFPPPADPPGTHKDAISVPPVPNVKQGPPNAQEFPADYGTVIKGDAPPDPIGVGEAEKLAALAQARKSAADMVASLKEAKTVQDLEVRYGQFLAHASTNYPELVEAAPNVAALAQLVRETQDQKTRIAASSNSTVLLFASELASAGMTISPTTPFGNFFGARSFAGPLTAPFFRKIYQGSIPERVATRFTSSWSRVTDSIDPGLEPSSAFAAWYVLDKSLTDPPDFNPSELHDEALFQGNHVDSIFQVSDVVRFMMRITERIIREFAHGPPTIDTSQEILPPDKFAQYQGAEDPDGEILNVRLFAILSGTQSIGANIYARFNRSITNAPVLVANQPSNVLVAKARIAQATWAPVTRYNYLFTPLDQYSAAVNDARVVSPFYTTLPILALYDAMNDVAPGKVTIIKLDAGPLDATTDWYQPTARSRRVAPYYYVAFPSLSYPELTIFISKVVSLQVIAFSDAHELESQMLAAISGIGSSDATATAHLVSRVRTDATQAAALSICRAYSGVMSVPYVVTSYSSSTAGISDAICDLCSIYYLQTSISLPHFVDMVNKIALAFANVNEYAILQNMQPGVWCGNGSLYTLTRGEAFDDTFIPVVMFGIVPLGGGARPLFTALAAHFAIFNRWYGALPAPPQPNDLLVNYAPSAQSLANLHISQTCRIDTRVDPTDLDSLDLIAFGDAIGIGLKALAAAMVQGRGMTIYSARQLNPIQILCEAVGRNVAVYVTTVQPITDTLMSAYGIYQRRHLPHINYYVWGQYVRTSAGANLRPQFVSRLIPEGFVIPSDGFPGVIRGLALALKHPAHSPGAVTLKLGGFAASPLDVMSINMARISRATLLGSQASLAIMLRDLFRGLAGNLPSTLSPVLTPATQPTKFVPLVFTALKKLVASIYTGSEAEILNVIKPEVEKLIDIFQSHSVDARPIIQRFADLALNRPVGRSFQIPMLAAPGQALATQLFTGLVRNQPGALGMAHGAFITNVRLQGMTFDLDTANPARLLSAYSTTPWLWRRDPTSSPGAGQRAKWYVPVVDNNIDPLAIPFEWECLIFHAGPDTTSRAVYDTGRASAATRAIYRRANVPGILNPGTFAAWHWHNTADNFFNKFSEERFKVLITIISQPGHIIQTGANAGSILAPLPLIWVHAEFGFKREFITMSSCPFIQGTLPTVFADKISSRAFDATPVIRWPSVTDTANLGQGAFSAALSLVPGSVGHTLSYRYVSQSQGTISTSATYGGVAENAHLSVQGNLLAPFAAQGWRSPLVDIDSPVITRGHVVRTEVKLVAPRFENLRVNAGVQVA